MSKLVYALISSAVVAGAAAGLAGLAERAPEGAAGEALERFVLAPGQMLAERLEDEKAVRALRKRARKGLDKAADAIDDKLEDYELGAAAERFERLTKLCTVASWTAVGFALSLLMTLALGVSSFKTALGLGLKLTLAMLFLQAALVFGGLLVYQRLAGS